MGTWAWLIAYLLGFALLQLYLYRYFIGRESTANSSAETAPQTEGGVSPINTDGDHRARPDREHVACGACGAHNEATSAFTYCKRCGARL